jgi:hypothetical protein
MKVLKTTAAFTLMGLLTACGSTSKPITLAEVDNYSGSFAENRSYALNLMEAARFGGAKDVKLKDGDSVIDLSGSNASYGFIDSLASGGSLLTASLSGLAGGLLTPDSDAQYNKVIALIDVDDIPSGIDVNAYAKKAFLEKVGNTLNEIIYNDTGTVEFTVWSGIRKSGYWDNQDYNGDYAISATFNEDDSQCKEVESLYVDDLIKYGYKYEKEQFEKNVDRMFKGGCGVSFYSLMVEDKVTNKKLPWLKEGAEFLVVTATMSFSNISLNYLSKQPLNQDGLYIYYTSNGANVGKLKDTSYPYIQAPHGKEMYFIKP